MPKLADLISRVTLDAADVELHTDRGGRTVALIPDHVARPLAAASRGGWVECLGLAWGESAPLPADMAEVVQVILGVIAEKGSTEARLGPPETELAARGSFYGFIVGRGAWDVPDRWWRHSVKTREHTDLVCSGSPARTHRGGSGWMFSG